MAIEDITVKTNVYVGDGSNKSFSFSFRIFKEDDLKVYVKTGSGAFELQELNIDYSLSLTYNADGSVITGGTITYPISGDALTSNDYIYAIRETDNTQEESSDTVSFKSKDVERGLDKATMCLQEISEELGRCVKVDEWQDINPQDLVYNMEQVECIVETYSNGSNWYRLWSDGWCEQGGTISSESEVTFLKAFRDTNYTIITCAQGIDADSAYGTNIKPADKTTTSFTPLLGGSTNGGAWIACGYSEGL